MKYIIGADEVAWGTLAGPFIVAASVVDLEAMGYLKCGDSKKYSSFDRMQRDLDDDKKIVHESMFCHISPDKLCEMGPTKAREFAFKSAIGNLRRKIKPRYPEAIVDGSLTFGVPNATAIAKADDKIKIVGFASCLAKLRQKALMAAIHEEYPEYGFDSHAGYGTPQHIEALREFGVLPSIHRIQIIAKMFRRKGWELKTRRV